MSGTGKLKLALPLAALIALFMAMYPLFIMRPFDSQSPRQLQAALYIARWGPPTTLTLFVLGMFATAFAWRSARWPWRAVSIVLLLLLGGSVALANTNIFEKMFHPRGTPQFVANADAHLDSDDMLLLVKIGNEAHAYPIRSMGYHHIVNDVVDTVPIVATY